MLNTSWCDPYYVPPCVCYRMRRAVRDELEFRTDQRKELVRTWNLDTLSYHDDRKDLVRETLAFIVKLFWVLMALGAFLAAFLLVGDVELSWFRLSCLFSVWFFLGVLPVGISWRYCKRQHQRAYRDAREAMAYTERLNDRYHAYISSLSEVQKETNLLCTHYETYAGFRRGTWKSFQLKHGLKAGTFPTFPVWRDEWEERYVEYDVM
jgi:hypothetical protein